MPHFDFVNIRNIIFARDNETHATRIYIWLTDINGVLIDFTQTGLGYAYTIDGGNNWINYWVK